MTGAITGALKERLERERRVLSLEARILELHTFGQRCARLLRDVRDGPSATEHGAYLYDEHGLPQ